MNKEWLENKLLDGKDRKRYGFWEIWSAHIPDYGPTDPSKLVEIAEGTYAQVVNYAIDQGYFTGSNEYSEMVYYGEIKWIPVPVIKVDSKSLIEREIEHLEVQKQEIENKLVDLKADLGGL